nr:alpha/beta hydrolase [Propionibacteriales bacterium]
GELNLRSVRRAAPHARSGLVPDSGHFFPEERPGYVADRLLRFLR